MQKYLFHLADVLYKAGMVNRAKKNEIVKITDSIWQVMHMDV